MIGTLVEKINFKFLKYSFLTLLDKTLSVLFTLFVLEFLGIKLYNTIEFILAVSSTLYIVQELGISTYIFKLFQDLDYQWNNENSNQVLRINSLYILIGSSLSLLALILDNLIISLIILRITYLSSVKIKSALTRVQDLPNNIFYFTIPANIFLILICLISSEDYFLITLIIFHLVFLIISAKSWKYKFSISSFFLIKESIFFCWPIILNVFVVTLLSNFLKLYGWNSLPEEELVVLNYAIRFASFSSLFHVSFVKFFIKKNYIERSNKSLKRDLSYYLSAMLVILLLCWILSVIYLDYNGLIMDVFSLEYISFFFVPIAMSFSAYLEVFLARENNTLTILKSSLIGFISFILITVIYQSIFQVDLFIINLFLIIIFSFISLFRYAQIISKN